MENKAHALAAGAFLVLLFGLLVSMAVWLTRDTGEQVLIDVTTRDTVTGLQPQAAVQFKGIHVGKVVSISFDRDIPGQILVRLAVNDDTPLTRSTFASLGFQGVTGIAFVQLDDANESTELLVKDAVAVPRIPMRAGLVSQLTDQGGRLLAQLEETSRRVNHLLDAENQKALMGGIASLGNAAAGFAPVLREAGNTLQTFRSATRTMTESLVEVKKASTEISQMVIRVQQPGGTLEQFSQGAVTMNSNLLALQTDTLPRLNQLLDEAARTTRAVGRSASALNDNPQALIFGYPVRPGPGEPGFSPSSNKP